MINHVHHPARLADLWPLLDDGVAVMAGGTDLLVRMRARGQALPAVALLGGIKTLQGVEDKDGLLRLGACTSHADLVAHPLVRGRLPVLAAALEVLGSPAIRNMGTLGGNLVTASPAGDSLPPLYALEAEVELLSRQGVRRLPVADFILGPGVTALQPGEILAAALIRPPCAASLQHHEKVGRRGALAIAVASLAAVLELDDPRRVRSARLAVGSVAPTALRCPAAEAFLCGRPLDRETLAEAGRLIREAVSPVDDIRASASYRRQLCGRLPLRLAQLGGGTGGQAGR